MVALCAQEPRLLVLHSFLFSLLLAQGLDWESKCFFMSSKFLLISILLISFVFLLFKLTCKAAGFAMAFLFFLSFLPLTPPECPPPFNLPLPGASSSSHISSTLLVPRMVPSILSSLHSFLCRISERELHLTQDIICLTQHKGANANPGSESLLPPRIHSTAPWSLSTRSCL